METEMPTFKEKLKGRGRLTSHICTIPSPIVTQALAAAGADALIIDMEHGAIDHAQAHAMIAAVAGTGCAPLVRVPEIDETVVKRVLDLGAEGICFPLVRSVEDAKRAVASMKYPPGGSRTFGPFLAANHFGETLLSYGKAVEDRLVCMLLIETADAVEVIEDIVKVEGIDVIIPAQFDLSNDLGIQGQFDHPDFLAAVERVERAVDAAGIPRGQVGLTQEQADAAFSRGNRVIAGFDVLWLRGIAEQAQRWCD